MSEIIINVVKRLTCFAFLSLVFIAPVNADVRLPRLLSDGAILQRDKPLTIWGWADEGEQITLRFAQQERRTRAKDGRWEVSFPAMKAGGPYELTIQANNTLQVKDIWLGDLWIAAGQSNMELPLRRVHYRYPTVIAETRLPKVREFSVPVAYAFDEPREDYTQGQWKTATPDNLAGFSAVGFFFARDLHQEYGVPIGILSIAVGGSPVEAWMSEAALQDYPEYLKAANKFKDDAVLEKTIAQDKANSDAWYAKTNAEDAGLNAKPVWSATEAKTNDWKKFQVPGFVKEQGIEFTNGIIWFKKTVTLTEQQAQQAARLWLGAIVDGDQVYLNGQLIGQTGYQYPPRIYDVPEGLLKAGNNEIRVRVTSYSGKPGFVKDKDYALKLTKEQIDLSGDWFYKIGMHADAMLPSTTIHYQPTSLFKAKLAPAFPFNIKGAIWFQGESNVTRWREYEDLFAGMIGDWRAHFDQGNFPFLFVQLANFMEPNTSPGDSEWAQLREAQRKTLAVPKTAMAVAIDVGEWNDIHPLNKQAVGERLALAARQLAYGEKKLLASGPQVKSVKRKGKTLVIRFDHVGKGLKVQGDALQEIAIAGKDQVFVWAKAKLDGNQLIVWHDDITEPVWVRYAWADNPADANLYNSADLPASPFQVNIKQ